LINNQKTVLYPEGTQYSSPTLKLHSLNKSAQNVSGFPILSNGEPAFLMAPAVADVNKDNKQEIVVPYYNQITKNILYEFLMDQVHF